jgi:hypothetical protein
MVDCGDDTVSQHLTGRSAAAQLQMPDRDHERS